MTVQDIGPKPRRPKRRRPTATKAPPPGPASRDGVPVRQAAAAGTRCVIATGPGATLAMLPGAAGVTLSRRADAPLFQVAVTFMDGRAPVPVGALMEEADVVAHWRRTADLLGLPLLVECADGSVFAPYRHLGRLLLGPFRYRRRNATLSRRRPRFLQHRRTTRQPTPPAASRTHEPKPAP